MNGFFRQGLDDAHLSEPAGRWALLALVAYEIVRSRTKALHAGTVAMSKLRILYTEGVEFCFLQGFHSEVLIVLTPS